MSAEFAACLPALDSRWFLPVFAVLCGVDLALLVAVGVRAWGKRHPRPCRGRRQYDAQRPGSSVAAIQERLLREAKPPPPQGLLPRRVDVIPRVSRGGPW